MPENSKSTIQIAICDDDRTDRLQMAGLAGEIMKERGLKCSISPYESGTDLLAAIQRGAKFHILLLDVMMEQLNGIELAAALRKLGNEIAIIFISSNREMALRGYEVCAVRYLAKPVQPVQLREALLYCYNTFCENKELLLPTSRGQRRVSLSDIVYAEAVERVTKLVLKDRQEKLLMKFSDLSLLLPERQFVLCHRSYLVNLDYVSYVRSRELELSVGEILPVSKYRLRDLQRQMVDYLSD